MMTIFTAHTKKALLQPAAFQICISVDESIVEEVKIYLSNEGYEVGFGGLLSSKPNWLALNSTVFYYHKESEEIAKNMAEELKGKTGIKYVVQRGAGLGVLESERKVTFFIHVVK